MSLKQLFDNIQIELVKRKYYNANKVDSLLGELRAAALAAEAENLRLSGELSALQAKKDEIGEAVMSARLLHNEIVQKANLRAEEITAEAQARAEAMAEEARRAADAIIAEAQAKAEETLRLSQQQLQETEAMRDELVRSRQARQEYAVGKVENAFSMLRRQHQQAIEQLNLHWQDFLCGLLDEDLLPPDETEAAAQSPAAECESEAVIAEAAVTPCEAAAAPCEPAVADQPCCGDAPADLGDKVNAIARELSELEQQ